MKYEALHPLAGWKGLVMQVVRIGERLFATGGLGSDGQLIWSDDDGSSWTKTTWSGTKGRAAWKTHMQSHQQHGLRQVWGLGQRELVAVGEYGALLSSADGGASWRQETFSPTGCQFGVMGRGAFLYVAGDDGIYRRKRSGKEWKQIDESRNLCRIFPVGDELMVIGDGGVMLVIDLDDNVRPVRTGTRDDLYGFVAIDERHWIVVGKKGLVMVSDDAGASFEKIPSEAKDDLFAVVKLHSELFAVVGHKGTVMLSPTGRRWQMQDPPAAVDLWGASSPGDGTLYIAGGDGHAWKVRDFTR